MATEKDIYYARGAYKTVCDALDDMGWTYERDDDKLIVSFGVNGENMPITVGIACDVDLQILQLISFLPFDTPSNMMAEVAAAVCAINYKLAIGSFDLGLDDGSIVFKMGSCFRETHISSELVKSLIFLTCSTVDKSNADLLALCQGDLTLKDILEKYS